MIEIRMLPKRVPMTWQEFKRFAPKRSIALDGFVSTGPRFSPRGPHANYNHHEDVPRLETRATCAQVLLAMRLGLFNAFRDGDGNPSATLFANDCDEDVCLATFLLKHHQLVTNTMNPVINRLVSMEDMLDTTAGCYPFPTDLPSLQSLMWVFQPYHDFRAAGRLQGRDAESFMLVVDEVHDRILKLITNNGGRVELKTKFDVLAVGRGWTMVREVGRNARIGLAAQKIQAYLSVRERQGGRWDYVIGRSSPFIPINLIQIQKQLNLLEKTAIDCWGGSDMIIGSPRIGGSSLPPTAVGEVIDRNSEVSDTFLRSASA